MKTRILLSLTAVFCLGLMARAQVVILNDSMFQGRLSEIRATVVDSLTNEPVPFASVYLIPSKDTTITNFTLTDAKGQAKLDEVPYGSYVLHIEMMGYVPMLKERYFRERRVDIGTVKLKQDLQFLQAAVVTDVGNPIVIKQDTVEFNASSFRVGANAMLKDLLQRMPGMEITDEGKVKFNGESIDKLTVGGRTFFFGDQSTALNNLPAAVVDKIRVIDRESESTRSTGVQDGTREKVLDVGLKKEYEQGWFGNAAIKGGATIGKNNDVLRDDRGLLYNANALVSAYNEKDQVTVIGNGQNVNDANATIVMINADGERTSLQQGITSAAQLGVNVNTSRVKDVETTVSANYKYGDTESATRTDRTTYNESGDLSTLGDDSGRQYANSFAANAELKKEKGNLWFHVSPSFRFSKTDSFSNGTSETSRLGTFVNRSESSEHSVEKIKSTGFNSDATFRNLWGKKGRSVRLSLDVNYSLTDGNSDESSLLKVAGGEDSRYMQYETDDKSYGFGGSVRFTEPLSAKWTLAATGMWNYAHTVGSKDAFDLNGFNDYYSSENKSDYRNQSYDFTLQYKFAKSSWITLGAKLSGVQNETFSKSFGVEETTGKDEWQWFVTPTLRFQHMAGINRISASVYGYSGRPSASRMLPALTITNPSRIGLGNVYLKPYSYTYFSANWNRNDRTDFTTLMVYLFGQLNAKPVVSAQWYDADGIMYSIPVNSRKPNFSGSLTANYTMPLESKKNWTLSLGAGAGYAVSTTYQAKGILGGIDKDNFDYTAFMDTFWGNAGGDLFYSGQSGFRESRTNFFTPYARFRVKYNQDNYSFSAGAATNGHIARYSLNPDINMNTLDSEITGQASYTTRHELEFNTDIKYVFYKGYSAGYGRPEWQWNASVSKNIGAFNLSVTIHDILNKTRSLTHTTTSNYEEDSYRLVMGRYILFGIKWNFGKMNATHNQRAQSAAWNMVW